MRLLNSIAILSVMVCATASKMHAQSKNNQHTSVSRYVNPFVGTTPLTDPKIVGFTVPKGWRPWSGLTFPGSSMPNAMVQLSPITEYGSGAGYEYEDSTIIGFAHTNKGHWNLCNVPVLPIAETNSNKSSYASKYSHDKESAAPGYYQVYLQDYGIDVQLTSTLRCGFHEYDFKQNKNAAVLFDLARANNRVKIWSISQADANSVKGFQDVGNDKIFFYATFNRPIDQLEKNEENSPKGNAIVHLKSSANSKVEMKIGLSFVSSENAKQNLNQEIGNKSFAQIRKQAAATWEELLSKIKVDGGTEKQRGMFYSSLYRAFLWPALRSDVNGEFTDAKDKVVKASFNYYTVPSLWDDYRNKLVLLSIMSPKVTADVIKSLKDMGDKTGFIPTFFHGDHAASFIAGSYNRGIDDFDVEATYKLLLRNAYVEGSSRPHLKEYIEKGYISTPHIEKPHVETKAKAGVAKTLEYAYDDYSLAQMAKKLGDTAHYRDLINRSKNYKNVFDTSTRFMRGKLENGEWVKNFNPEYPYYEYMYREANAWQVSFYTPHDMKGLIALYGGAKPFEAKLDSLFSYPWNPEYIARNVETMVGQYCHGNQPDHEAPFAYHFIGKPEKSQKVIDYILDSLYGMGPQGLDLSGMDDAGEMSSWYVFGALGLYPYAAVDSEYLVTVPIFNSIQWKQPNGKTLVIKRTGKTRDLQNIKVNNKSSNGYFISHDLFRNGGVIEVQTRK